MSPRTGLPYNVSSVSLLFAYLIRSAILYVNIVYVAAIANRFLVTVGDNSLFSRLSYPPYINLRFYIFTVNWISRITYPANDGFVDFRTPISVYALAPPCLSARPFDPVNLLSGMSVSFAENSKITDGYDKFH